MIQTTTCRLFCIFWLLILASCATRIIPADFVADDETRPARQAFVVTVFTDDTETGRQMMAAIEDRGYSNPGNQILDTPNNEFNIKWGAAPNEMVDELCALVEESLGHELVRYEMFAPDDHDIFLNLPVCLLGGASRPESCKPREKIDPRFDRQGIPQACGLEDVEVRWGAIAPGVEVILGRHRAEIGDRNWVPEMDHFVGQRTRVRELFGSDAAGCPVVMVEIDDGEWFWRVRDMRLAAQVSTPGPPDEPIPTDCGMTDSTVEYGPIALYTEVILGRHTKWNGDDNWNDQMEPYVGKRTRVVDLSGTDEAGCAVVQVDIDSHQWYWRVRDMRLPEVSADTGYFPQECDLMSDEAVYGAARIGAKVRLGRHRKWDGDANWVPEMEHHVGKIGRVTQHLGTDASGCPVIRVDTDNGEWAWRVRDLSPP